MQRICVYCGSRPGQRASYRSAAQSLAHEMLRRDLGLVYGGASVGVMGELADAVVAGGGVAIGVIPESLMQREIAHTGLTELHVVGSMHERKSLMAELSDGFIALPGGLGTLEEIFETLTWAQLGFHAKPCALLNTGGYYDHIATFLDHAVAEAFIPVAHRELLSIDTDPGRLLERFMAHRSGVGTQ